MQCSGSEDGLRSVRNCFISDSLCYFGQINFFALDSHLYNVNIFLSLGVFVRIKQGNIYEEFSVVPVPGSVK